MSQLRESGAMSASDILAPQADLAVVVVNYNAGEYLARCVMSLVEASGELELDVLIVDNASRDGSVRVAVERTPKVRLIENPTNRGLSAAWNQGARAVDAPWILFLNPDAEIWHGDLGGFVKVGEGRADVALLGPAIRNPNGTIYESGRAFPRVGQAVGHAFLGPFAPGNRFTRDYRQTSWDRSTEREVDWVSGAAMLIRRSAFEQVGGFDEEVEHGAEDTCLHFRCFSTLPFGVVPEVLMHYRRHPDSASADPLKQLRKGVIVWNHIIAKYPQAQPYRAELLKGLKAMRKEIAESAGYRRRQKLKRLLGLN